MRERDERERDVRERERWCVKVSEVGKRRRGALPTRSIRGQGGLACNEKENGESKNE
jgi:hypothetical protein